MADTRLDEQEQVAWRTFIAMQEDVAEFIDRRLRRRSSMSKADFQVLAHLSEAPGGTLRSSRLCALLQWEKSRLSQHLGRMQDRGLVVRERSADDQRAAVVTLTDVGRRMVEEAAPRHAADARAVLIDALDPDELAALTTIADKVRRRLVTLQEQDDQG